MKTPAELINDLKRTLVLMEDDCTAVFEYSSLLGVLMAGPDAETAMFTRCQQQKFACRAIPAVVYLTGRCMGEVPTA
jgi:hypothetical protein